MTAGVLHEVWDGNLLARPRDTPRHQLVVEAVAAALRNDTRMHVLCGVAVRLGPDRIAVPDIVVAAGVDLDAPVVEAASVRLVCEVVSPVSAAVDRLLKMHGYAAARIPHYLLVEQENATLHGYRLAGGAYVERSVLQLTAFAPGFAAP